MKNAQTLLNGYVTRQGLPFEYVEGEELLVDSFNYTSNSRRVSYVAFVTNKRIILKQTQSGVSFNANGWIGEACHADMRFVWFKDAKYIGFKPGTLIIGGTIVDFSEEEKSNDYDNALILPGFGGLSYGTDNNRLSIDLNDALKKVCAEYKISYKGPMPGDTTSTPQEDKFYMNKYWGWRKLALGALLVPAVAFVGFAGYTIATMDWETESQTQSQVEQVRVAPEPTPQPVRVAPKPVQIDPVPTLSVNEWGMWGGPDQAEETTPPPAPILPRPTYSETSVPSQQLPSKEKFTF